MKKIVFVFIFILLISGCELNSAKNTPQNSNPTVTPLTKVNNINFELSSFTVDYKDDSSSTSEYISEKFTGNGIINAIGDESLVKKPYQILIDVKKISGGTNSSYSEGSQIVIVRNGIGKFTTNDSQFQKNATRLVKPVYDIKIIGYLPYVELIGKPASP